jgi:hypothetical protein
MPWHHDLETYLHAYLDGSGISADPKGALFRTIGRTTGQLTAPPLPQANAHAMIRRRAAAAGIKTQVGNHTFRATGITAYLKNGGTLENAAAMANQRLDRHHPGLRSPARGGEPRRGGEDCDMSRAGEAKRARPLSGRRLVRWEADMGLYVHSLERLPADLERDYYVYVLDYGWEEPIGEALRQNFSRMADLAARNRAVVIAGTDPHSFVDQVFSIHVDDPQFSWQAINGEHDETILPAIMITTIQPAKFKETQPGYRFSDAAPGHADDNIILIPLRLLCKTGTEVVALIEKLFADIAAGKPLSDFAVAKHIRPNQNRGSYSGALILKPTLWGMGVDLKELFKMVSARRA